MKLRKSVLVMAGIALLALAIGINFATVSKANKAVKPIAVEFGQPQIDVPQGAKRVTFHLTNEKAAKGIWDRYAPEGSAFSLDKLNSMSIVIPENDVPCWCESPNGPAEYIFKTHECIDCVIDPALGGACGISE